MNLEILRHSCSHILAQAVKELYPGVKLGIGPSIEDGFYYDFDLKDNLSEDDLPKIEGKMKEIIEKGLIFTKEVFPKNKAIELFTKLNEPYKVELIKDLPDSEVSVYRTGSSFIDLCRGPHIHSTNEIKAFKLLSIAGSYWHGIETNPMLTRIYGTVCNTKEELEEYLRVREEIKKRDHRKLGKQLELFDIFHEEAGAGLVFYFPKGALLRTIIEDYEKIEHRKRGYQNVITPHVMRGMLWQTSGHLDYYRQNMYAFKIDDQDFVIKPMNCPGHILIYKSKTRSFRDLPLRLFELGTVYRHERAGVLHGLLRVRGFTQDDAHIFCTQRDLCQEIKGVIEFVFDTMRTFGFVDAGIELSTRPVKSIGSDQMWLDAQGALESALKEKGLHYKINPGDGAFYGPKIDIKLKDALKREWQCATIQCDFALPERFDLKYIDTDGKEKRPIMIHRVILGSIERFIGTLIEHYAGDFPLWLSPVQVAIIPIKQSNEIYANEVMKHLSEQGIRVEIDTQDETLDKRIRNKEIQKIPYVVIIGNREEKENKIALRKRKEGDLGKFSIEELLTRLKEEIKVK
ncbi:MAG: threonine--tRNA ligase [Candidatus Omnitrophota bacterium]